MLSHVFFLFPKFLPVTNKGTGCFVCSSAVSCPHQDVPLPLSRYSNHWPAWLEAEVSKVLCSHLALPLQTFSWQCPTDRINHFGLGHTRALCSEKEGKIPGAEPPPLPMLNKSKILLLKKASPVHAVLIKSTWEKSVTQPK